MKYILKMAFRNIGRNRRRTMLSAIAISIAVMVVVIMRGYIGGMVDSMFDSLVKIETGHIKIMRSEYRDREDMMPLEHMIDGFDGGGYEQVISVLESVEGVETAAPRIKFGVLLSFHGKSGSALGIGVDPEREEKFTSLSRTMVKGQYFGHDENSQVMIVGSGLAKKMQIEPDDRITILARTAYDSLRGMTFTVKGIFEYGISSLDEKIFYVPISEAARLLEMGNGVSEIVLMVSKPEDAEKVADEIRRELRQASGNPIPPPDGGGTLTSSDGDSSDTYAVVPWQQQGGLLVFFKVGIRVYWFIYVFLLILASTVIINTTMMVIYERIREIGTIGALGMTGRQIILLFVIEAMIISAIGSFMGTTVGGAFDLFLSMNGIPLKALTGGSMDLVSNDVIYPRFGAFLLISSFLFGVAVASAAACIPSWRAAKVEPVEALRSI